MKTSAVVIDRWKLPIFTRRLTDAGYAFEEKRLPLAGAMLLRVQSDDLSALAAVVKAANDEAARSRMH